MRAPHTYTHTFPCTHTVTLALNNNTMECLGVELDVRKREMVSTAVHRCAQRGRKVVGSFSRPILRSELPSRSRAGLISAPTASPPPCLPPRSMRTARALASLDAAGTTWPWQLMGGGNGASRAGIIVGSTQLFVVGVGRVWRGHARARKPNAQYLAQVRFQPAPSVFGEVREISEEGEDSRI